VFTVPGSARIARYVAGLVRMLGDTEHLG
jgi:hypothetical protein